MNYLIVGPTIVNDIFFDNKLKYSRQIGGAVFALQGALLWNSSSLYVSNVGKDFSDYYGSWIAANKVSTAGLFYALPHTQYTNLHYLKDELHDEISIYGKEDETKMSKLDMISSEQLLNLVSDDTKGMYIEISENDPFWSDIQHFREKTSIKIMWEVRTSSVTTQKRRAKTLQTLEQVDIFSVNLPEAKMLFAEDTLADVLKEIDSLNTPCYLRLGSKGSMMIKDGKHAFAPSLSLGTIIDTTGCGNASTAAALVGFSEGAAIEDIARMGNIAAWFNLLQKGPYPLISEIQAQARKLLANYPVNEDKKITSF